MQKTIELSNYTKIIKNNKVLNQVNAAFLPGSLSYIAGANGSGKTMLIRALCRLIHPTQGQILYNNEDITTNYAKQLHIGAIIEGPGFWPYWTGYQNLAYLASIKNYIGKEEIINILKQVGLENAVNVQYRKFSLGMKQRLSFAQAIMEDPDFLFLDEPFNGLDDDGVDLITQLIYREHEKGKTIIVASHIPGTLLSFASAAFRMKEGVLLESI